MDQAQRTPPVARQATLGALLGAGFGIFVTAPSLLSSGFAIPVVLMAVPLIVGFIVFGGGITGAICIFRAEAESEAGAAANHED